MTLSTVIFLAIFYQTFNLTLVKKYLKTAKIIDESLRFLHVYKLKMSYRIEQNDNDIFFILHNIWRLHFFTIKDRSAIYLVKK
jgi:hypothetical protein